MVTVVNLIHQITSITKENEMGKNRARNYEWATVAYEQSSYDVCVCMVFEQVDEMRLDQSIVRSISLSSWIERVLSGCMRKPWKRSMRI